MVPAAIVDGSVGVRHAGINFVLDDVGLNADGDYVPPAPAFAIVDGVLPPGLTLATDGRLGGTPTTGGTYAFTVEGEDANGFVATRSYAITIADPTPPQIDYTLTALSIGSNG